MDMDLSLVNSSSPVQAGIDPLVAAAPSGQAPLEGADGGLYGEFTPISVGCSTALLPASVEPVAYASAEQIEALPSDPADEGGAAYIPLRHTASGKFQMPLYASPPASGAVEAGWQLVPVTALKWLNGEGPDHNGDWFGDVSGRGNFWWRKHFSDMLAAEARKANLREAGRSLPQSSAPDRGEG